MNRRRFLRRMAAGAAHLGIRLSNAPATKADELSDAEMEALIVKLEAETDVILAATKDIGEATRFINTLPLGHGGMDYLELMATVPEGPNITLQWFGIEPEEWSEEWLTLASRAGKAFGTHTDKMVAAALGVMVEDAEEDLL